MESYQNLFYFYRILFLVQFLELWKNKYQYFISLRANIFSTALETIKFLLDFNPIIGLSFLSTTGGFLYSFFFGLVGIVFGRLVYLPTPLPPIVPVNFFLYSFGYGLFFPLILLTISIKYLLIFLMSHFYLDEYEDLENQFGFLPNLLPKIFIMIVFNYFWSWSCIINKCWTSWWKLWIMLTSMFLFLWRRYIFFWNEVIYCFFVHFFKSFKVSYI